MTRFQPNELRALRVALGVTGSQLAAALGVHATTVSRWENAGGPVVIEGAAALVLSGALHRVRTSRGSPREAADCGRRIAQALLRAGTIPALAALVGFAAGDGRRDITPASGPNAQ